MHTALLLVLVGGLFMALVYAVVRYLPSPQARTPADRFLAGDRSRADDRCWYAGGFLYCNPDDPAPLVPNRFYVGWTVNLGHPLGKVMVVVLIGLLLLPLVLAIGFPGLPAYGCHPSGCRLFH